MVLERKKLNVKNIWIEIMDKRKKDKSRFVVCIKNKDYPVSLELYKIYRVLSDEKASTTGDLRVIDESGDDYLFSSDYFIPIEVPDILQQVMSHVS
jgi:hypothetical protein